MSRAERKAATRAKLIAVAQEAFSTKGYDEVTMRTLAQAAGVSTGAYFAHWTGKAHLYADATGNPPPDVPAFLERVAITTSGYPGALGDLSEDALALRKVLTGVGS